MAKFIEIYEKHFDELSTPRTVNVACIRDFKPHRDPKSGDISSTLSDMSLIGGVNGNINLLVHEFYGDVIAKIVKVKK